MTISYVRETLTPRLHDRVLTPYGKGVVTAVEPNGGSTAICLLFGTLYCRQGMHVHKMLSAKEYAGCMDKLEEYRHSLLEMACLERGVPCDRASCVQCLLEPEARRRRSLRRPKVQTCDVCGNLVCPKHRDQSTGRDAAAAVAAAAAASGAATAGQHFVMCLTCKRDLDFDSLDIHSDDLHEKVVRLFTVYDRMVIQLCFCVNEICEDVARRLSALSKNGSKVKLGATAASIVSGGLAVAGTLTLLTPAGVPLIIAAIATGGASTAVQMGNTAFQYTSAKQANQLGDRIIGWQGLCLGILSALERLRWVLIKEPLFRRDRFKTSEKGRSGRKWIGLNGASRATSMGLRATSVVASTPPTAYSSLLSTSLAMTPVVGAALSLGIMACDAQSIHATIRKLSKPSDMAVALLQVQKNFPTLIPTSIEDEALLILEVVRELQWLERQAAALLGPSSSGRASPRDSFGSPSATRSDPTQTQSPPAFLESDDTTHSFMNMVVSPPQRYADKEATAADDASLATSDREAARPVPPPQGDASIGADDSFHDEKKETLVDLDGVKVRLPVDSPTPVASAIESEAS